MRRRLADLPTAEYDRYLAGWGLLAVGLLGFVFARRQEEPLEAVVLAVCGIGLLWMGLKVVRRRQTDPVAGRPLGPKGLREGLVIAAATTGGLEFADSGVTGFALACWGIVLVDYLLRRSMFGHAADSAASRKP